MAFHFHEVTTQLPEVHFWALPPTSITSCTLEVIEMFPDGAALPSMTAGCQLTNLKVKLFEHLCKELATSEQAREVMFGELESKAWALEKTSTNYLRLHSCLSVVHKEVRRLQVRAVHAPGQHSYVTEAAIAKATRRFKAQSNMWRIKHSSGQIEDWVCRLICRLVTVHHLPASHAPGAVADIVQAIRVNIGDHDGAESNQANASARPCDEETFSNHLARWFLLEGHIMGKIQLAEEFKATPGRESYLSSSCILFDFTRSVGCQW